MRMMLRVWISNLEDQLNQWKQTCADIYTAGQSVEVPRREDNHFPIFRCRDLVDRRARRPREPHVPGRHRRGHVPVLSPLILVASACTTDTWLCKTSATACSATPRQSQGCLPPRSWSRRGPCWFHRGKRGGPAHEGGVPCHRDQVPGSAVVEFGGDFFQGR